MENTTVPLNAYLKKYNTKKEFERGLIILDVLDYINPSIPQEKRLMVVFVFSKIQKTFSFFKHHSADDNENELKKIDSLYNNLDDDLKFYLSLSYLPMRSYYYYSLSNFKLAADDLESLIHNSNIILKNNLKLKTLINSEQLLNLFRVNFTSKEFIKADYYASKLIMYSIYNAQSELINGFDIVNVDNRFQWTSNIVDSIFIRYLQEGNLIKLINLIDTETSYKSDMSFHLGFKFLKAYYSNNYRKAKEYALMLLKNTDDEILPDIMLCTILSKLEEILSIENIIDLDDFKKIFHSFVIEKTNNNEKIQNVFFLKNNELIVKA